MAPTDANARSWRAAPAAPRETQPTEQREREREPAPPTPPPCAPARTRDADADAANRSTPHSPNPHLLPQPPDQQLPLQVHHHRRHGRRQVLPPPPVHGQALPACPRPHHRRRIRREDGLDRRQADQAADLGYCGAGELPVDHAVLLSRSSGRLIGVRRDAQGDVCALGVVAGGREAARQPTDDHHADRQQVGPVAQASGE